MSKSLRHLAKGDDSTSELIRCLREVCILFRTAWKHRRSRDPSVIDDGGRGLPDGIRSVKVVGLCGIESGRCNQRWRVGIFIVERHDVKDFRGKFAL
jgi:hypothetical protein